jgi:hypothetical protein
MLWFEMFFEIKYASLINMTPLCSGRRNQSAWQTSRSSLRKRRAAVTTGRRSYNEDPKTNFVNIVTIKIYHYFTMPWLCSYKEGLLCKSTRCQKPKVLNPDTVDISVLILSVFEWLRSMYVQSVALFKSAALCFIRYLIWVYIIPRITLNYFIKLHWRVGFCNEVGLIFV